ncbi:MAG: GNAT family N-acetyltransferase [Aureispira sp.]|nr:GNAT family N-acetyltransferase [Aureispira sp.]
MKIFKDNNIHLIDIQNRLLAQQILNVQQAAYTVESKLIQFDQIPYLRESLAELQSSKEAFIAYLDNKQLIAVLSYELISPQHIDICRLVVSPKHFGKGIATQLLNYLEFQTKKTTKITVSTAKKNIPAIQLYQNLGYVINNSFWTEDKQLELVEFAKTIEEKTKNQI